MPALTCALAAALMLACAQAPAASLAPSWSTPLLLSNCAGTAPHVVFPSDSPTRLTGAGAIVWGGTSSCGGGQATVVTALGPLDLPLTPSASTPRSAPAGGRVALRAPLAAAGAPHGQLAIVGLSSARDPDTDLLLGAAGGPLTALALGSAAKPLALATGYLGDVAIAASAPSGGGLRVRIERWNSRRFEAWRTVAAGGAIANATLTLDYRSDALLGWTSDGALYTRDLPAGGSARPLQRIAAVAGEVHLAALRSDDNHAILAWSERTRETTSIYLDVSAVGTRFGRPKLIERYADPAGTAPATSPTLIRLRSESVLLGWTGAQNGHWLVRVAPVDLHGMRTLSTITALDGADALLAGLVPAPDGSALVCWSEPQPGAPAQRALYSASAVALAPGQLRFAAPEQLTATGPVSDPALAFDPSSGRAVAAWRGSGGQLLYAVRSAPGEA